MSTFIMVIKTRIALGYRDKGCELTMYSNSLFYHKVLLTISPKNQQSTKDGAFYLVLHAIHQCLNQYYGIRVAEQELQPKTLHHVYTKSGHKLAVAAWRQKGSEQISEWALQVSWDESDMQRRRWTLDFGMKIQSAIHIDFSFLAQYQDRLGGCLRLLRPPRHVIPQVVQAVLDHKDLSCTSGGLIVPSESIELTTGHLQIFVKMLEDPQRRLPMVIITCPKLIVPAGVMHRMRGNVILYHTDNRLMVQELNRLLGVEAHIQHGGVQIFQASTNPQNRYPHIAQEELNKLGGKVVVDILSQAYAENPTKRELNQCITYDTIAIRYQDVAAQRAATEVNALKEKLATYGTIA